MPEFAFQATHPVSQRQVSFRLLEEFHGLYELKHRRFRIIEHYDIDLEIQLEVLNARDPRSGTTAVIATGAHHSHLNHIRRFLRLGSTSNDSSSGSIPVAFGPPPSCSGLSLERGRY